MRWFLAPLLLLVLGAPAPAQDFWAAQVAAVEAAAADLPPERPGVVDVYVLAIGGDGQQTLFEREADYGRRVLATRYGAEERTLLLANGPRERPGRMHASHATIRAALMGMAARMNPDEDVLALFMTSHGEPAGPFVLAQPGWRLASLGPQALAAMLADAGVTRRLIIISACHSGAFVPHLSAPDAAIYTAAAASQSSFGCSDDRDLSYFGDALLRRSIPQAPSLEAAFSNARKLITAWELAGDLQASLPQKAVGTRMADVLATLDARARLASAPPLLAAECTAPAPQKVALTRRIPCPPPPDAPKR
jgi:hypothetical protein